MHESITVMERNTRILNITKALVKAAEPALPPASKGRQPFDSGGADAWRARDARIVLRALVGAGRRRREVLLPKRREGHLTGVT